AAARADAATAAFSMRAKSESALAVSASATPIRGSSFGNARRSSAIVASASRARLRVRELEAVLEVVGIEREERAVDLDRAVPLVARGPVAALDGEPRLAREIAGQDERGLRGLERLRVVAEARPRRGERGAGERVLRVERDGLLQPVSGGHGIEDAK